MNEKTFIRILSEEFIGRYILKFYYPSKIKKFLLISDEKTYELLDINNPKIKIIEEKMADDYYLRTIILKNKGINKILACSITSLVNLQKVLKRKIIKEKVPIGLAINQSKIKTSRKIKKVLRLKLKDKKYKNKYFDGRIYKIKSNNKIINYIMEIFLE